MLEKAYSYEVSGLFYCHNFDPAPISISTHLHDHYEIFFFLSGDITYFIEGQAYLLKAGDIILTNNRELHRIVVHSDKPFERKFLHFRPEYVAPLQVDGYNLLHFIENRKLGCFNRISAQDADENGIYQYLSQMEYHIEKNSAESAIMVKTLLIQMLIAINEILTSSQDFISDTAGNNTKVVSILHYINQHYDQKITLDLLQELFYVNKYYLAHFFKKSTGFSVMEYTTYKRIMIAKGLLDNKMPVLEVAEAVGFSDYSNFYKAFKKIVGVSPKRYK